VFQEIHEILKSFLISSIIQHYKQAFFYTNNY